MYVLIYIYIYVYSLTSNIACIGDISPASKTLEKKSEDMVK